MANALMQQEQAVVSTSGAPLSMKNPESWPKCFLGFFYGDAVPNMTKRGEKGTGTVHAQSEHVFSWLQDREEREYSVPSD